ncbi:MAG: hypothetical protein ACYDAD_07960 [Acidimicrobiales bacterium]
MAAADPAIRSAIGRLGAHAMHAGHDARSTTRAARAAFEARFAAEVDPDGVLSPDERARRAEHARKAYFLRLSLLGAAARRGRSTAAQALSSIGEDEGRACGAVSDRPNPTKAGGPGRSDVTGPPRKPVAG